MSRITDEQRKELDRAIDQVVELCQTGLHPNDAIIKTATSMELTPDRLPVLVNLYNLGATASRWETGESIHEKVASFPIADIDVIVKKMFPVKKAAAHVRPPENLHLRSMASLFGYDPMDRYRKPSYYATVKSACAVASYQEPQVQKKAHARSRAERMKSEADRRKTMAVYRFDSAMDKLANLLKRPDQPSLDMARDELRWVKGALGERIMDIVEQDYPSLKNKKMYRKLGALKKTDPFYAVYGEVESALEKLAEADQYCQETMRKCAELLAPYEDEKKADPKREVEQLLLRGKLYSTNKAVAQEGRKRPFPPRSAASLTKEAVDDVPRVASKLDDMLFPSWSGASPREFSWLMAMHDPRHESRLRNIRTQTLLIDLMNTDEYLSQQEPEAVLAAYNDLLEIAPDMMTKRIFARQALRQYMSSGSLDLSTVGQLSQQESVVEDRKSKQESANISHAETFSQARLQEQQMQQQEQQMQQQEQQFKEQQNFREKELKTRQEQASKDRAARQSQHQDTLQESKRKTDATSYNAIQDRRLRERQNIFDNRWRHETWNAEPAHAADIRRQQELAAQAAKDEIDATRSNRNLVLPIGTPTDPSPDTLKDK